MTDRVQALTVILDKPMRDDDVEHLVNAIRMMRNVKSVENVIWESHDALVEMRTAQDLRRRVLKYVEIAFSPEADNQA